MPQGFEVGSNRLGGLMVERKNRLTIGLVLEPIAEVARQGLGNRLVGRSTVLRAAGSEEDTGIGSIDAKRLCCQASQLLNSKSGR